MRYIGSKIKLLEIIRDELNNFAPLPDGSVFCDLFAGTNVVSDFFQEKFKITKDLPKPVKRLLKIVGINVHYETSEEILQEMNNKASQFERAKAANELRNQSLFRNNIREKGIPTKCAICGSEIEDLLEAAHLCGVAQIRQENGRTINKLLSTTALKDLIDPEDPHRNDMFYKKYTLVNSGDNGIWLCKNHHGLFDNNYFCFDSKYGKIIFKVATEQQIKEILGIDDLEEATLHEDILNERTAVFLKKRLDEFNRSSGM